MCKNVIIVPAFDINSLQIRQGKENEIDLSGAQLCFRFCIYHIDLVELLDEYFLISIMNER
jgi:hypothetical protein